MPAIVAADVAGGAAGFPMDLCRLHLADARDHFGGANVMIVERYTR